MPTIKDVAMRAKTSISTVSRVLNGTAEVNESKVIAVREAIEYYQYQPNQSARGLVTGKTKIIGVYSPFARGQLNMLYDDYLLEGLRGVDERISQSQYSILLLNERANSQVSIPAPPKFEEYVRQKRIDALIIMARSENEILNQTLRQFMDIGFPIAHFGKKIQDQDINIYASYDEYMEDAIFRLYQEQHRKILICTGKNGGKTMQQNKAPLEEQYKGLELHVQMGETDISESQISDIFQEHIFAKGCTAVIWEHLDSIQHAIHVIAGMGKKVPEDISMISVEHVEGKGASVQPQVNTYYVPARSMGWRLADSLLQRLEQQEETQENSQTIYPKYIERESVKRLSYKNQS